MATLFVEELCNLDFAFLDPVRGLVGDTLLLDLELGGALDAQGMVLDFGRVKRELRAAAEDFVDHKLAVPMDCAALQDASVDAGRRLVMALGGQASTGAAAIEVVCPEQAVCRLAADRIDPDTLGAALARHLRLVVPDNVQTLRVMLRAEAIAGAAYHYCHGLRKHDGDCQRIAHGHRSRIRIERAGQRAEDLEHAWAARWNERFLGTEADALTPSRSGHRRFGYDAPQGRFEIELPADRVDVLDCETTVEHLAAHIATTLAAETAAPIRVRAYEGVRKGAIAEAGTG